MIRGLLLRCGGGQAIQHPNVIDRVLQTRQGRRRGEHPSGEELDRRGVRVLVEDLEKGGRGVINDLKVVGLHFESMHQTRFCGVQAFLEENERIGGEDRPGMIGVVEDDVIPLSPISVSVKLPVPIDLRVLAGKMPVRPMIVNPRQLLMVIQTATQTRI